jgi:hypothetical protein
MLLLQSCITANKVSPVTVEDKAELSAEKTLKEAKKIIVSLPTCPKPRVKPNLEELTLQDMDEYITYQADYIGDLQDYIIRVQAVIDVLNKSE